MALDNNDAKRRVLVTGAAGFIGFHLCELLSRENFLVAGYDGLTDYYDPNLKRKRISILSHYSNFSFIHAMLQDRDALDQTFNEFRPEIVVHLAAQAGVRYSLENPHIYIESNVLGTMNVLESARRAQIKHLLMASTSSVYGANKSMPFDENQKADTQLTIYAATKKANESMSHAYSHLWKLPVTMFRFFTVYGPWGRPDMALFKFAEAMLEGRKIDLYNSGDMYRDFTYVEDLVRAIRLLIDVVPAPADNECDRIEGDSLSSVAPWRLVNIGNSQKIRLDDLVEALESSLGVKAKRNFMPIQQGDVPATWANVSLLERLTGFRPSTDIAEGVSEFVKWFKREYGK